MSLFQKSVEKKYLNELDTTLVDSKYKDFQHYFGNPAIQENIRNAKEEQFQEGFLRELFVSIFGYTLNPHPNFNLTTELKNIANSKKADGAILKGEDAIAVIELKGTDTTDLDKIETQAFGYKNHHPKCVYVITSNFEKLRFYIQNAVDHLDFDLFNLTREQFSLLWLCLAKDNLLGGLPLKIKESSVLQEENITKKLYADYSKFREAIYNNLVINNPETDKLLLFRKTQKLIDRFLFIFFAEDRLLVPPNSISQIIEKWKDDVDFGDAKPLYHTFKKYFHVLNVGRPKSGNRQEIFAYNGGLFSEDEILDNIQIDDAVLYDHTLKLSQYNYETDVDVNILGHIFEHSLGEIENVQAEIKGEKVDSQKTKRKKDGIFYTPKYITKYIVENTVGKLCEEKRASLEIIDEEYAKGRKNRKKDTITALDKNLTEYRNWLLSLTILDSACGSGAFLNQALDFLITEHRKIDDLRAQLFGSGLVFSDITTDILEKNIYGVDINEESVEIAKLSLWLRTAQKGRKLNKLNNNIKCGNSLIDDPEVAGEKAFNWQNEFPEIFTNGGFDVVIGNPPYVRLESMKEISEELSKMNYRTFEKRGDLYGLFVERGFQLLKNSGVISYIMPNKWLQAGYGKPLREFFLSYEFNQLIDFGDIQIFEGATTYPCIFISKKATPKNKFSASVLKSDYITDFYLNIAQNAETFETNKFSGETWIISSGNDQLLLERLKTNFNKLIEYINGEAFRGIIPGLSEAFIISESKKDYLIRQNGNSKEIISPIVRGRNMSRYGIPQINECDFIILAKYGCYNYLEIKYPAIFQHLSEFEKELKKRGQCNGSKATIDKPFPGQHHWLELDNCPADSYLNQFTKPKIMYQAFQVKPCFIFDEQGLYCNNSMWFIPTENKALLAVLNSKMGWWLITKFCTQIQNGYQLIWKYFGQIPVPNTTKELSEKAEIMLSHNKELQESVAKFHRTLQRKFNFEEIPSKLAEWYKLSYPDFTKELAKKKIKLSLADEAEWEDYFTDQKQKAQTLKAEIDKTDREIDRMVYALYGLTEDEIKIIEEK